MYKNDLPCGCLHSIHYPIAVFGNTAICFDFTVHAAFIEYLFYKGRQEIEKIKNKDFLPVNGVYSVHVDGQSMINIYNTHCTVHTLKELQTKLYIKINNFFLNFC